MALTDKLVAIADAIRGKTGGTEKLTLAEMPLAIAGIEAGGGGGDAELLKSIVEGSATELSLGKNITKIKQYLFYNLTTLTNFDFTYITSIGAYAFSDCSGLGDVVANSLSGMNAIGGRAFLNCKAMTSFESMTYGGPTSAAANIFQYCTSLANVNMPACTSIGLRMFSGCTALTLLDFPVVASIAGYAFENCSTLNTLVLRNNAVATLANINTFTDTPFASGGTGGTVYVPSALISSYQTATNWSTLYAAGTCNFVAIEGSEYE